MTTPLRLRQPASSSEQSKESLAQTVYEDWDEVFGGCGHLVAEELSARLQVVGAAWGAGGRTLA